MNKKILTIIIATICAEILTLSTLTFIGSGEKAVVNVTTGQIEEIEEEWEPDQGSTTALAKTLWGECRGVKSKTRQAAVAWCVLNRLDSVRFKGDSVIEICSAPYQFDGYSETYPVTDKLYNLARDVLKRWHREKCGETDVGRVLPSDYYFFIGDGIENHFSKEWKSTDYWAWELPTPYED